MIRRVSTWALLLAALVWTCSTRAEKTPGGLMGLDLDQLTTVPLGNVYGASKAKQKTARAPSTVTVLHALDVKRFGWRTLGDILRSVRGFYVTYDRNYAYVGVRGFGRPADYNSRVLVVIDGHRINDPVYGAAYVDTSGVLDVDLIDRIEIIRGPSSSLYGTGAFFAVVNIITREAADLRISEVSGEAGTFRRHRGRVTLGHQFKNDFSAMVSMTHTGSEGDRRLFFPEFADPVNNFGFAENADRDAAANEFVKLSWRGFTLDSARVRRKKHVPTAPFGSVFDTPATFTFDELRYLHGAYEGELGADTSVFAQLSLNQSHYDADYVNDPVGLRAAPDLIVNRDLSDASWWIGELRLTHRFSPTSRVVVGTEYQKNRRQDQSNFDQQPFLLRLDDQRRSFLWGAYVQAECELATNLVLNAGVRYDFFSTAGDTTNPRLGLIATPRDTTVLKLLYGTAFRAPNTFELFYSDNGLSQKPPVALKNETIATYEGVWEERINENLRATAAYYYYQMYDLVDQTTDPADGLIVFANQDTIDAKGFELELTGRSKSGIEGRVSYALQRTRVRATDATLTNSPQSMFKSNVSVPLANRKLFASVENQFTSARITQAGGSAPGYLLTNLTLYAPRVRQDVDISATLYNLFDRRFSDLGGPEHRQDLIAQDGRTARVKATARF